MMRDLLIEATKKNPFVDFKTNGQFLISGNSIGNDHVEFYEVLKKWCLENAPQDVELSINIPYINTGNSQSLFGLMSMLYSSEKVTNLTIDWHCDEDDADMLEFGQELARHLPNTTFKYTVKECA